MTLANQPLKRIKMRTNFFCVKANIDKIFMNSISISAKRGVIGPIWQRVHLSSLCALFSRCGGCVTYPKSPRPMVIVRKCTLELPFHPMQSPMKINNQGIVADENCIHFEEVFAKVKRGRVIHYDDIRSLKPDQSQPVLTALGAVLESGFSKMESFVQIVMVPGRCL